MCVSLLFLLQFPLILINNIKSGRLNSDAPSVCIFKNIDQRTFHADKLKLIHSLHDSLKPPCIYIIDFKPHAPLKKSK